MRKYVFGHKKPDTDAVMSAIGVSYLKNSLGEDTEPRVLGALNKETEFAIKYFGLKEPKYLNDVKLQVRDINYSKNLFKHENDSIYDGYQYMIDKNITGIPLVGDKNKFAGLITIKDLSRYVININHDNLYTSYSNLLDDLQGEEVLRFDEEIDGKLFIASYRSTRILENIKLDNSMILILGDRHSVIEYAIESKVKMIILTGGSEIYDKHIELARKNKVNIIRSPFDTYHLARLLPFCNYIKTLISNPDPITFSDTDFVSEVIEINSKLRHTNYPVVNKDGKCLGLLRIIDLNDKNPKRVILTDHNEPLQSVDGLSEAIVEEVFDHHALSSLTTVQPINYRGMAVGSTCTIVYILLKENKLNVPKEIAGALLSGILSDTLILRSPTTTEVDKLAVKDLSKIAGVNYEKYGMELLKAGTSLDGMSPEDVLFNDYKLFTIGDKKFSIGQFFTMNFDDIKKDIDLYVDTLNKTAEANGFVLTCLYVTDIIKNGSYVLFNEKGKDIMALAYRNDDICEGEFIENCLSRKKNVVPIIMDAIGE